ncbi:MAG: hypothetical protein GY732_07740 [Gammaproteobacteria bacterium]|nr:hypothetical protein [Gammaproteobacteria bacterium]
MSETKYFFGLLIGQTSRQASARPEPKKHGVTECHDTGFTMDNTLNQYRGFCWASIDETPWLFMVSAIDARPGWQKKSDKAKLHRSSRTPPARNYLALPDRSGVLARVSGRTYSWMAIFAWPSELAQKWSRKRTESSYIHPNV